MAQEFSKKFYKSIKWKKCRDSYIAKRNMIDGGLCEECKEEPGEELHHQIHLTPGNINNPDITLAHENLKWLCRNCHFIEHRKEIMKGFEKEKKESLLHNGMYFDEEGRLTPFRAYIVYGAPAAGKSTYVKEHMQDGDLVVDLDLIKQAISLCNKTDAPDNLLPLALQIRDIIYQKICDREVDCMNAWVIAQLPKKKDREELQEKLDAELIFISSDYEECIRRAGEDNERENKIIQRYIIDKWFRSYEP